MGNKLTKKSYIASNEHQHCNTSIWTAIYPNHYFSWILIQRDFIKLPHTFYFWVSKIFVPKTSRERKLRDIWILKYASLTLQYEISHQLSNTCFHFDCLKYLDTFFKPNKFIREVTADVLDQKVLSLFPNDLTIHRKRDTRMHVLKQLLLVVH